ncbi:MULTISPECIES: DHH family phosphoesterase [Bacillus]|uniref:Oligoribonuclease n=2 Tax=Bacillus TaxID=1386 RepID=A0A0M4FRJ5_9BACI|nr:MULTISPECIES: bifunctional oligoribonuclease/PAP phosphatase NrnA [Bacillus]ALC82009.1 oligoribonuclease [Bacillus gobiensis]MBP1083350.1 phosphoesterase RecJ-like protein [Bacillus capparidis]MED1097782.1 bifunctional oligoribonuclease/PAP phosphatase NrnA [Bacillus capparidis]
MKSEVIKTISLYDTIIIHRHVRPDPDAYGSQCGLAELLKQSYPHKKIYVAGTPEPSLSFLYPMDEIEDEIYKGALVIVCDTANQARICDSRFGKGDKLIKIDHHPNEDPYGDLLWVDTEASSVSEMIYELYLEGKNAGWEISTKAAELIYAGIVGDTGRFLFPNTTKKTLKYAGELIEYPFSSTVLFDQLYETKLQVVKLNGYIYQHVELSEAGVASVIIKKDILEKYKVTATEASQLVGTLGSISGIKAWVFFVEEENQIRVRFRSKGPVINEIAKKYKGGGHPLAAGASISEWSTVSEIIDDLEELCKAF